MKRNAPMGYARRPDTGRPESMNTPPGRVKLANVGINIVQVKIIMYFFSREPI